MARSSNKYIIDFGIEDIYKSYVKDREEKGRDIIPMPVFRKILKHHNKEVVKNIVEFSDEFRMPYRLGYLRIRKFKQRLKLDPDGNLKTRHLQPDWQATNALWAKNKEAEKEKKIIWHTNVHTRGFYYKWYWDKRVCNIKNSTVYSVVMSRQNKRAISQAIKQNKKLDYYE